MISNFTIHTDEIPIYDYNGNLFSTIKLPEKITPSLSRRGGYSDSGIYYKGAGIIYRGHLSNEPKENEKVLKQSTLPYQKYTVVNPTLIKRFGIFTFPHQPAFSDFEGTCGPKEAKLPDMVKSFDFSAIEEIVDVIDTKLPNQKIYAYRLKKLTAKPLDALSLFEYILTNNYNSAWDKNLWADISCFCYVRDLADWFVSDAFCHKLGTIYALLNSILKVDKYLFADIVNTLIGYQHFDALYIPYISALIVRKFSPESTKDVPFDLDCFSPELYEYLLNELYSGKACCHLEKENDWLWIKDDYKKQIPLQMKHLQQDLMLSEMRFHEIN